jgi:hypothetical protein
MYLRDMGGGHKWLRFISNSRLVCVGFQQYPTLVKKGRLVYRIDSNCE